MKNIILPPPPILPLKEKENINYKVYPHSCEVFSYENINEFFILPPPKLPENVILFSKYKRRKLKYTY